MALLVVDLDGTLLGRNGGVSPRNLEALDRAREAGFEVVLATGRSWKESRRALDATRHRGLFIGAGGSVVNDAESGATLRRETIDPEIVREVSVELLERGHRAQLLKDHSESPHDYCLVGSQSLDEATTWWFAEHELVRVEVECLRRAEHRPMADGTLRVGTVAPADRLEPVSRRLREVHGDRLLVRQWGALTATEVVGSRTHLLEVFAGGVDKWSAVRWICERRGIDPERTVAIGDGANDVGMIEGAGLGIAMGNAVPEARAAADEVVSDHERDGVAEAVSMALGRFGRGAVRAGTHP